jgi:hypothetical protein
VRITLNNICTWPIVVAHMCAIVYVVVIDDGSLVYISGVVRRTAPVVEAVSVIHILRAYEYPPAVGAAIPHGDTDTGAKRRPAAIAATVTPANPCRSPLITGYPYPAIVGVIGPAAIVIASPTPWIFRYPCVAIVGHHPVAACAIRTEVATFVRHPNVAILRVADPLPIGRKVIVECLVRYRNILCGYFLP